MFLTDTEATLILAKGTPPSCKLLRTGHAPITETLTASEVPCHSLHCDTHRGHAFTRLFLHVRKRNQTNIRMKDSHLLPHLLKVVEELQRHREPLRDEAAALGSSSHKPDNTGCRRYAGDVLVFRFLEKASHLALDQTKDLLDAVDPRHELEGGARGGVTLDVRLGSAVHRVEDDQAILRPSVLSKRGVLSALVSYTITQSNRSGVHQTHVSPEVRFGRRAAVKVPAIT